MSFCVSLKYELHYNWQNNLDYSFPLRHFACFKAYLLKLKNLASKLQVFIMLHFKPNPDWNQKDNIKQAYTRQQTCLITHSRWRTITKSEPGQIFTRGFACLKGTLFLSLITWFWAHFTISWRQLIRAAENSFSRPFHAHQLLSLFHLVPNKFVATLPLN